MSAKHSKLLLDESPLQVLPTLAVQVGVEHAIVLQQVQYMMVNRTGYKDENGQKWVRMSVSEWLEVCPWMSHMKVKRILKNLQTDGLVYVRGFSGRSNWYRPNYEKIEGLETPIERIEKINGNRASNFDEPRTICSNPNNLEQHVLTPRTTCSSNLEQHVLTPRTTCSPSKTLKDSKTLKRVTEPEKIGSEPPLNDANFSAKKNHPLSAEATPEENPPTAINSDSQKQKSPKKQAHDDMVKTLVLVTCGRYGGCYEEVDTSMFRQNEEWNIYHTWAKRALEKRVTQADVLRFWEWYRADWRGQNGKNPTLSDISKCWAMFKSETKVIQPPPPTDDGDWEADKLAWLAEAGLTTV